MPQRPSIAVLVLALTVPVAAVTAVARAIEVNSWNLTTATLDLSGSSIVINGSSNTTVVNPLHQSVTPTLGLNSTSVAYDYSWLTDMAFGTFNNSLTHSLRSREIREQSVSTVRFSVAEDAVFHLSFQVTYNHTPNDEYYVFTGFNLYDFETDSYPLNPPAFRGGAGYFLPSQGTFSADVTYDLIAGRLYQFNYNLDSDNIGDPAPSGSMDITAQINWWITPEPSSLLLILIAAAGIIRRRTFAF